ncbi:NAD-dependent succinate-semialdehyde dehydrogenase [Rhodococcus sp. HNM0569]|uniref:NAD-dependent succinate-semialdehyde dehydrogenase n=1 Tax=Rhodococcus sp. HNM0569 TaxID=2716340 RepID=UPI00146A51C6|nr:NAD-dependent succinate-semialdehyde dehydrogenase [Rhodococcus sp. HNM0569]NLU84382.1 NAD-dependent succinate-semialdehyde dehydrogenase [Rhodococcus sp. HNM0569]
MTTTSEKTTHPALSAVPLDLYLDGAWTPAASGRTFAVENPATGETLAHVADGGPDDARRAVETAARVQDEWARTAPRERSEILRRAYDLILARTDELATIMTLEMGKPFAEARGEVAYGAEFFRWFSEEAVRIAGDTTTTGDGKNRIVVGRVPVGPCVLITPWNFPLAMGTRKIGPAIAAGCTMVFKPAPQTPLTALALTEILAEAGLPKGVLNVVPTTDASGVVTPWLEGGLARKLSFTGSTGVGKILLAQAATTVMRTSMELGGNAPFVVCADADLDKAVEGAMVAKLRNMGEACTAANRFYVHRDVADEFTAKLAQRMSALTVGDGLAEGTDVGPLIDAAAIDKVRALVTDAIAKGASVAIGGDTVGASGHFYQPTVLTGVPRDADLASTEIFGPVAPIFVFDDEDEIVRVANDTDWGLVGYLFTQDLDRAFRMSDRMEVGMVGLNTGLVSNPAAPFGGVKQSGLGREGGRVGIDEFLEYKYLAIPKG